MLLILVILILVFGFGGGLYPGDGTYPYRTGGFGIGGLLLIILLVYLFMGHRL
jgi:hypothetical protein